MCHFSLRRDVPQTIFFSLGHQPARLSLLRRRLNEMIGLDRSTKRSFAWQRKIKRKKVKHEMTERFNASLSLAGL